MINNCKSHRLWIAGNILLLLFCLDLSAQTTWPKDVNATDGSKITIYEPAPEKLDGNDLYARAAVSIRKKSGDEPVFGVMWFNAALQTDAGSKIANVQQLTVVKSKFADDDETSTGILKTAIEQDVARMKLQFDMDKVQSGIVMEKEETGKDLKNDAPQILYRNKPTTLIVLDGDPIEEQDDNLKMTRVVNSPYLIVKNQDDKKYYLYGGSFWYSSSQVETGWINVKSLPSKIKLLDAKMKEEEKKATDDKESTAKFTAATDILVSTEPAELIQTEGNPTYKAVEGSTLLYVDNSLDEIFKDVETQKNYILIAGRWYNSATLEGPWNYVPAESLPPAFAKIPQGSEKDGVLASVAGTAAAEEAVVDAQVPQTAKVNRSSAKCEVIYDGDPKFVPIENTNLSLAENSNLTVMRTPDNQYYALENGIWFISNYSGGPWEVANERPGDVDRIPSSSSAYNSRYVQVYETYPDYVYVGYTPGYMGNYVYHNTVVWGTGWRYRSWYGRRFWPRPYTWGFGMHYNPWTGWNTSFGLGFNTGWAYYNAYQDWGGGWYGPPMYRPPYRPWGWNGGYYGNRPVNRPMNRPNIVTNRPNNWNRPQVTRPVQRPGNIYGNRQDVVTRDKIQRPAVVRPLNPGGNGTAPGIPRPGVTRPGITRPTTPVTNPGVTRPVVTNPGITRPTTPVTNPGVTRPTTPVTNPGITKPVIPVQPRRPPVTQPVNPVQTTRPVTRPVSPRPTQPVTQPATRPQVTRPVTPVNRPITRPAQRPAGNTERPARRSNQ